MCVCVCAECVDSLESVNCEAPEGCVCTWDMGVFWVCVYGCVLGVRKRLCVLVSRGVCVCVCVCVYERPSCFVAV